MKDTATERVMLAALDRVAEEYRTESRKRVMAETRLEFDMALRRHSKCSAYAPGRVRGKC